MKKSLFILMVDDDEDDCYFLNEATKSRAQDVLIKQVKNGDEAIKFLQQDCKDHMSRKPDLIFMDLNMDKLNGIEASQIIKQSKEFCTIPLVILSDEINETQEQACTAVGVDGVYLKPNSIDKFADIFDDVKAKFLVS